MPLQTWAAAGQGRDPAVHVEPRPACFCARTPGLAVGWAYKHDVWIRLPYQDRLCALVHEPSFRHTAGEAVFNGAEKLAQRHPCKSGAALHDYTVAAAQGLSAAASLKQA